jgi:hypothetical protein
MTALANKHSHLDQRKPVQAYTGNLSNALPDVMKSVCVLSNAPSRLLGY